jgi:glycosyltransferase involved in cell wall biosynthesis
MTKSAGSSDFLVIIPTFRRPEYLRQAVRSALTQEGATVIAIVVDDSPERSAEGVVRELLDPRVVYVWNAMPTGGSPATVRNLGLSHALQNQIRGEFVHFLDDDDVVPTGLYRAAKEIFLKHPSVGVLFGRIDPFGDPSKEPQLTQERRFCAEAAHRALGCYRLGRKWPIKSHTDALVRFLLTTQMMFDRSLLVCSSALLRHECIEHISGFDPNIRLCEDSEFYARAFRRCGPLFVDQPFVHFRISGHSLMHTTEMSTSARAEEELAVIDGIRRKQAKLRKELGLWFFAWKAFARLLRPALRQ